MSALIIDGLPGLPAATDLSPYALVYVSGGNWTLATATNAASGVVMRAVKSGEIVQPRPLSAAIMAVGIASGVIAAGAVIVQDAAGKVKTLPTSGGGTAIKAGVALNDSAAADGDWINFHPLTAGAILTVAP